MKQALLRGSFQSQSDLPKSVNSFMLEEDKVVYNRGSIKIKVIRGEMGKRERERERGRRGGSWSVRPSVRSFVMCLPQKLVNFELIICLARGVHAERFNMRTIITLPNSYVSHGEHILLMIKLRERVFLIFRQPSYQRRRRRNVKRMF